VAEYIVYRSNPADATDKRTVARLEAANAEEACRTAGCDVTLAPGETLSAEPAAIQDAREAERNRTSRDLARDSRGGEGPTPEG
jgi:hypothetical protein